MKQPLAGHLLRKIRKATYPYRFVFVDTESATVRTDNEHMTHIFKLGCASFVVYNREHTSYREKKLRFTERGDFWREVIEFTRCRQVTLIVAHNVAYDMQILAARTYLTDAGYDCEFIFEQGLSFIGTWKKDRRTIVILNNNNWFNGRLADWGNKLNFPKLVMPEGEASQEDWFTYCERDCDILVKLQDNLIHFLMDNDLGPWKYTLASLAYSSYRYKFMTHRLFIPNEQEEIICARSCYHGGRTECLVIGNPRHPPYYKLDVNSMYPAVMAGNEFPTSLERVLSEPKVSTVRHLMQRYSICGKFLIKINEPFVSLNVGEHTCYPVGEFWAYLNTPELDRVLRYGKIRECGEVFVYNRRPIFREFVEFYYGERMAAKAQGNELMSYMFKILLNSLYGKFGQHHYEDRVIGQADPGTIETCHHYSVTRREHSTIRQVGRNVIETCDGELAANSMVSIAAHVTAYARCMLYDLVIQANRQNVYYVDTDSLFVNEAGYHNLQSAINPTQLGYLKLEETSNYLNIRAPKDYQFGEHRVLKGVPRQAAKVGEDAYVVEIWPRFNAMLKMLDGTYHNIFRKKQLTPKVATGNIGDLGVIRPFVLG